MQSNIFGKLHNTEHDKRMNWVMQKRDSKGTQSLWRDARAEPLGKTAKAAKSIRWMVCAADSRFVVLRSAEGETLAGGSEGAGPPASLAQAGKPKRLFRWSGALWLATMRNLPYYPQHICGVGTAYESRRAFCMQNRKLTESG